MQRDFGDLQNLPQDLRSLGRFCGPQTVFAWDLDSTHSIYTFKVCKSLFRTTIHITVFSHVVAETTFFFFESRSVASIQETIQGRILLFLELGNFRKFK